MSPTFFFCCANCVCVSLSPSLSLSSFFLSPSSLINQAPFCWRTAPWEPLALSWLSLPHILKDLDHHTLGPPRIIALFCFTIPSYLYFCEVLILIHSDISCYLSSVACPFPGHYVGVEVVYLGHHLAMLLEPD